MLSPADWDLVRRDPGLPALGTVLDPLAMLSRLEPHWPTESLSAANIFYLRYKPGTSCLAGYRLRTDDRQVLLTVHARRPDAADKLANHLEKRSSHRSRGPRRLVLTDALTITVYPDDHRLPALRRLAKKSGLDQLAADLQLPKAASLELLRYRPGRRFVGRLSDAHGDQCALKVYRPSEYPVALRRARVFRSIGPLLVPEVRGASQRFAAIASGWIDGQPLLATADAAARAGAALRLLHVQQPTGLRTNSAAEQGRTMVELAEYLAALWPPLAAQAQRVSRGLAEVLAGGSESRVAVHGDFHLEQLIDIGEGIGIVDFDEAAVGAAAWDLGNIAGHLHVRDLDAPTSAARDFGASLFDAYRSAGGCASSDDVRVHTAHSIFRLAGRPFRERHPEWPRRTEAILALAEDVAGLSRQRHVPAEPSQSLIGLIADACNPRHVEARLDLSATGIGEWRIEAAALVRHKPDRRALIEYKLVNGCGARQVLLGKLRARGTDLRCFALHSELRKLGFGDDAADAIHVPEPIAIVPALSMWLQRKVEGELFGLGTGRTLVEPARAAEVIAKLHLCPIRPVRRHALADELRILDERVRSVSRRKPEWRDRLEPLRMMADEHGRHTVPARLRPIHRDFYHDHLLINARHAHLLDLDLVSMGDPAVDLGNFSAHLIELGLREAADPHHFSAWQHSFEEHYRRRVADASPRNIRLYEWLSLLRLVEIGESIAARRPTNEQLLQICEELAHRHAGTGRTAGEN
jgi:aminoglycoside phosphotransferase (APT) family kinase protein